MEVQRDPDNVSLGSQLLLYMLNDQINQGGLRMKIINIYYNTAVVLISSHYFVRQIMVFITIGHSLCST